MKTCLKKIVIDFNIFPSFNFNKKIDLEQSYRGKYYFNTSGYQKQYNTNNIKQ